MLDIIKSQKFILLIVDVVIGVIIYFIFKRIINRFLKKSHINKKKSMIISLIKNIVKYIIIILIVLSILRMYGVDTSAIIASIGVIGVVIGLAFQDLLSDFLAGMAIIMDNKYSIGDIVTINGFRGTVIGFGLISTKIKADTGEVMFVNNASFKDVINYSVNDITLFIELDVSYKTDIKLLEKTLNEMEKDVVKIDGYVGDYKLRGIQEFASSSIKYLINFTCDTNKRLQARRDYLMLVKKYFDEAKIEIPYSKLDVYIKEK